MSNEIVKVVYAECDYVQGYLRGGNVSVALTQDELDQFNSLDPEEQQKYISDCGELEVTDWRVEDWSIGDAWSFAEVE